MKKVLVFICALCAFTVVSARTKIVQGDFKELKGERFVGTTLDFSKAKFDGRNLEAHLFSMNISQTDWKAFETSCCVAINMAYAYNVHGELTLGLKSAKKTKYYVLIQPLDIDLDDGECDVRITLKDAATDQIIAVAESDSKAKETELLKSFMRNFEDRSFWEYNILHSMAMIGFNALSDIMDF